MDILLVKIFKTENKMQIDKKDLLSLLKYDKDNGIFTWKHRNALMFSHCGNPERVCNSWNTQNANKIAGCITKTTTNKYILIKISLNGNNKKYLAHRLAWLYIYGDFPNGDIDHVDGNGLNNCIYNLRIVDSAINHQNQKLICTNTSGFCGVYFHEKTSKWYVQIVVNGKTICGGGMFNNKDDAISYRKLLNIKHGFHENHGIKREVY